MGVAQDPNRLVIFSGSRRFAGSDRSLSGAAHVRHVSSFEPGYSSQATIPLFRLVSVAQAGRIGDSVERGNFNVIPVGPAIYEAWLSFGADGVVDAETGFIYNLNEPDLLAFMGIVFSGCYERKVINGMSSGRFVLRLTYGGHGSFKPMTDCHMTQGKTTEYLDTASVPAPLAA